MRARTRLGNDRAWEHVNTQMCPLAVQCAVKGSLFCDLHSSE
jgi:hypothetical protein